MNVFELTSALSILAGLIQGSIIGAPFGAFGVVLGVIGGLAAGFACYFIVFSTSTALSKVCRSMETPPGNPLMFAAWWIANFTSVTMMIIAPLATVALLLLVRELLLAIK